MLLIVIATGLLIACGNRFWEPRAPERSFTPEDLLIDQGTMPSSWRDVWGPFVPAGHDLCTTECAAIQFGVAASELPIQAEQDVYRYLSMGIAQRTFEKVYLPQRRHLGSMSDWTYQSPVADQQHFGCYDWEERDMPVCEWAGRYEEYIVVFWCRMVPGEMSLADIERVVRAIDERMAQYLDKPFEDSGE